MITHRDLHRLAVERLALGSLSEAEIRRAISALYYSLFHRLTAAGAKAFASGGVALTNQVARAFNHSSMRKLCDAYAQAARSGRFSAPLDRLATTPPDPRIAAIAKAFIRLQEARHAADYDLTITFERIDGYELMEVAEFAHWKLDELGLSSELIVFLAALLLADRWTRRG